MNDKQQLAAIGEQLTAMGERMGVQVQPMCMAKRIDELEAQVRVMAVLLRETLTYAEGPRWQSLIDDRKAHLFLGRIDAALAGSMPAPSAPEGWKLVPVEPTEDILRAIRSMVLVESCYRAMLAAAPSPDSAK